MINMSKACSTIFFFLCTAFILQNVSAIEPKIDVDAPLYNYLEPTKWGDMGNDNKLCSTGTQQSPINIDAKNAVLDKALPPLQIVYQITSATLMTNGILAQMMVTGKSELIIAGRSCKLLSLRWHTPSEHTIDGKTFVAELHQVFYCDNGGVGKPDPIIVATVYTVGAPDPIVTAVEPEMTKLAKEMSPLDENKQLVVEVPANKIAGALLNREPTNSYTVYPGSLTNPPCVEGVTWILTHPQSMSLEQAKIINELQSKSNKANSRPTQPLNGRRVQINIK